MAVSVAFALEIISSASNLVATIKLSPLTSTFIIVPSLLKCENTISAKVDSEAELTPSIRRDIRPPRAKGHPAPQLSYTVIEAEADPATVAAPAIVAYFAKREDVVKEMDMSIT
jgi:hypothetical protein